MKVSKRITKILLSDTKIAVFGKLFQVNFLNNPFMDEILTYADLLYFYEPLMYFKHGSIPNHTFKFTQLKRQ